MMENRQSSYPNTYRMNSTATPTVQNRGPVVTAQPMQKPCKKELMDKINQYSFAMNEANLFLDTHPDCTEALSYYKKHLEMRKKAAEEYAEKFGMLRHEDYSGQNTWQWTEGPWPWENEEV